MSTRTHILYTSGQALMTEYRSNKYTSKENIAVFIRNILFVLKWLLWYFESFKLAAMVFLILWAGFAKNTSQAEYVIIV